MRPNFVNLIGQVLWPAVFAGGLLLSSCAHQTVESQPQRGPAQAVLSYKTITCDRVRKLETSSAQISKFSAASGAVLDGDDVIVAADDENFIGVFSLLNQNPGRAIKISDRILPTNAKQRKNMKADFEALIRLEPDAQYPYGAILVIPSGSKPNRTQAVLLIHEDKQKFSSQQALDWSGLFAQLQKHFPHVNIEGGVIRGETLRLFQRGNGQNNLNAWIDFKLQEVVQVGLGTFPSDALAYNHRLIPLPLLEGIPLGISDATLLPTGDILFTASAEDTANTMDDGKIRGSVIGIMAWTGETRILGKVEPIMKVEGIDVVSISGNIVDVILVPDPDDRTITSEIYRARLNLSVE